MSGTSRLRSLRGVLFGSAKNVISQSSPAAGPTPHPRVLSCLTRPYCSQSEGLGPAADPALSDSSTVLRKRPQSAAAFRQQQAAGLSQAAPQPRPPPLVDRDRTPMSKPLPGIPPPIYAKTDLRSHVTTVSRLPNGLRVASEPKFGKFCTVGVAIDCGSRYEVAYPSGISHFIDKLAFGPTPNFPQGRDNIQEQLEKYGGICDCQGSRDTMIYGISVETTGLEMAVDILADVVLRPVVTDQFIEDIRKHISYELEDLNINPNPEGLLQEYIHAAAFRDNTIGLPRMCPPENIPLITADMIYRYLATLYDPKRIVLAGVGVDHERLVQAAKGPWNDVLPMWQQSPQLLGKEASKPIDTSIAQYTGGEVTVEKDLSSVSLGPNPMPELAHVIVGLESPSHQDEGDFIATCVLNMMMGGGGSFSAGGPGKGMYTRLYLHVLNRYHWIQHAAAYNHSYADSGIFCIHASCHPTHLRELVEIVCKELVAMEGSVNLVEFNRAKKQLQSMLLMNLESRPVVFEDVARQVLSSGGRKESSYYIEKIDQVTTNDIQRVAKRMLRSKPSVAALGTLEKLPLYSDICEALSSKSGRLPKRFTSPWGRS